MNRLGIAFMAASMLSTAAPSPPAPRTPLTPVPFTILSIRGRPLLGELLNRNRVFYASNYLQTERWLHFVSPTDREMLLRHDFVDSGVLAVFRRGLDWDQSIRISDVREDQAGDLFTTLDVLPPPPRCVVPPGQPPPPCPPPPPMAKYVLVAVTKAALAYAPKRIYVSEIAP